ncbi:MAG: GNAT family N-acetyltransferase [Vibrio sp.]
MILGCIDEFYIAPESRKQGYGQQLMAKMVQTFQNYGAEKVMVEVYDFNQSALRTYHKQGFDNYIHCLIKSI